jgi:hypothetical protein
MLHRAVFIKNMNFDKKVPDNFGISEIPKKSFPRNPGNFPRDFPKFPDFPKFRDFPEIPGFSEIFRNFTYLWKLRVNGLRLVLSHVVYVIFRKWYLK